MDSKQHSLFDRQISFVVNSRNGLSCKGRAAARCEADEHLCGGAAQHKRTKDWRVNQQGLAYTSESPAAHHCAQAKLVMQVAGAGESAACWLTMTFTLHSKLSEVL